MIYIVFLFLSMFSCHNLIGTVVVDAGPLGVQFIEWDDTAHHCIAVYGNVLVSKHYSAPISHTGDPIADVASEMLWEQQGGRDKLRNDAHMDVNNKPYEGYINGSSTVQLWKDMYGVDYNPANLSTSTSPDGKGVTLWIHEFIGNFQALQKTIDDMPTEIQAQFYGKIFQQLIQELPQNQSFTQSLEGIIEADMQDSINALMNQNVDLQKQINTQRSSLQESINALSGQNQDLQKQINELKSKIH